MIIETQVGFLNFWNNFVFTVVKRMMDSFIFKQENAMKTSGCLTFSIYIKDPVLLPIIAFAILVFSSSNSISSNESIKIAEDYTGLIAGSDTVAIGDKVQDDIIGETHTTDTARLEELMRKSNRIDLTWDPAPGNIRNYKIYVDGIYREWTTANSITMYLLEQDTEYDFQITAVDEDNVEFIVVDSLVKRTRPLLAGEELINPSSGLVYMGAFRLPAYSGDDSNWGFMMGDITFYPEGDPDNTDDYPGSIYAPGNATQRYFAEITIPVPVISTNKDYNDLNRAETLQEFADIQSPNMPDGPAAAPPAIEYLPAQPGQSDPYLYTCFGDDYQVGGERLKSFGAGDMDLSNPIGGWYLGPNVNYSEPQYMTTIDYIFDMPEPLNDHLLIAGGSRYGAYHWGPVLLAYSPWNDGSPLPGDGTELSFTPLLMYDARTTEQNYYDKDEDENYLNGAGVNDIWRGAAWTNVEDKSAIVISGIKGHGDYWYVGGAGPRMSNYRSLLLFYDPRDITAVADGLRQPDEPQPYAVIDLDEIMFSINENDEYWAINSKGPGGIAFDRENKIIYMVEQKVYGMYDDEAIIHVWELQY